MPNIGDSGISMERYNTKNIIEDFMVQEYEPGFRNEFATTEALINKLPKDTIAGKKKYKSFALGITDNVRALGRSNDTYELGFDSFYNRGAESVDAEFDTTKLMATFSITDEAILKGTGDGSLIDVLKDSLDKMALNLKVTMNRYTYGSHDGKIGQVTKAQAFSVAGITVAATKPMWDMPNNNYYTDRPAPLTLKVTMTNSACLLPGMGVLLLDADKKFICSGYIWQKINDSIYQEDVILIVDKTFTSFAAKAGATAEATVHTPIPATALTLTAVLTYLKTKATDGVEVTAPAITRNIYTYARQFNEGVDANSAVTVKDEYHGLEDIIMTQDNLIFGVDRSVYKALNSTVYKGESDGAGGYTSYYLGEELLRDMSDHLALTSPEGTAVTLVASTHRVISGVEKSMYQFKQYSPDSGGGSGFNLGGRPEIRFDNFILYKDKYARSDANGAYVYMLDQQKIGELVRRDFQWITSGEVNGILQRRPGTELYEGIMNKYADMYIDAWKCHGAFKNVLEPGIGQAVQTAYTTPGVVTVQGAVTTTAAT